MHVLFGFTMLHIVALFVAVIFACFANILRFRVLLMLFSFTVLDIMALLVAIILAQVATVFHLGVFGFLHVQNLNVWAYEFERFVYNHNIKFYALSIFALVKCCPHDNMIGLLNRLNRLFPR